MSNIDSLIQQQQQPSSTHHHSSSIRKPSRILSAAQQSQGSNKFNFQVHNNLNNNNNIGDSISGAKSDEYYFASTSFNSKASQKNKKIIKSIDNASVYNDSKILSLNRSNYQKNCAIFNQAYYGNNKFENNNIFSTTTTSAVTNNKFITTATTTTSGSKLSRKSSHNNNQIQIGMEIHIQGSYKCFQA
uniref:CSON014696 protein n=1 Tax=Culicoides sonorensis TaxID=179676 RepID=A0A336MBG6_CULSO